MKLKLFAIILIVGATLYFYVKRDTNPILCNGKTYQARFIGMEAPNTPRDMARTYSDAKLHITCSDGTVSQYDLSYNKLFDVSSKIGEYEAGRLYDQKMNPLVDHLGNPLISEAPDSNSLLDVEGNLFLVTHYEHDWLLSDGAVSYKNRDWNTSRTAMSMTLTSLKQDHAGRLHAASQRPIDFSSVEGLWVPCFGSQSPWNTHLGSEEDYDLFHTGASPSDEIAQRGLAGLTHHYFNDEKKANPYHYGHIPEVTVKADGTTSVVKHYSMGRASWEQALVLSDQKTAYFGDDGNHVGLYMYIADTPGDLSAGTLYAAKWEQMDDAYGGKADLSWYRLGHASDDEVKQWAGRYTFADIFDYMRTVEAMNYQEVKQAGFRPIRAGHSGIEWLRLKPGMENVAAHLETRRYAAYLGATTEFNKMEGVAFDPGMQRLYLSLSFIERGMEKEAPVLGFKKDDIHVAPNRCGGTYAMDVSPGIIDRQGDLIPSDYVATRIFVPKGLLGEPIETDALGNRCNPDHVANTDNLFFSPKLQTLFIGEDSSNHINNFLWAYDVKRGTMSRILSLVAGAESTGLQVVENLNGHAYIMSNTQHHGAYIKTTPDSLKEELESIGIKKEAAGDIGYIGGIPGL